MRRWWLSLLRLPAHKLSHIRWSKVYLKDHNRKCMYRLCNFQVDDSRIEYLICESIMDGMPREYYIIALRVSDGFADMAAKGEVDKHGHIKVHQHASSCENSPQSPWWRAHKDAYLQGQIWTHIHLQSMERSAAFWAHHWAEMLTPLMHFYIWASFHCSKSWQMEYTYGTWFVMFLTFAHP